MTSNEDELQCRFCREGAHAAPRGLADVLVSPCSCCGTQALIHLGCLHTWQLEQARRKQDPSRCGTCRGIYRVPAAEWQALAAAGVITPAERVQVEVQQVLSLWQPLQTQAQAQAQAQVQARLQEQAAVQAAAQAQVQGHAQVQLQQQAVAHYAGVVTRELGIMVNQWRVLPVVEEMSMLLLDGPDLQAWPMRLTSSAMFSAAWAGILLYRAAQLGGWPAVQQFWEQKARPKAERVAWLGAGLGVALLLQRCVGGAFSGVMSTPGVLGLTKRASLLAADAAVMFMRVLLSSQLASINAVPRGLNTLAQCVYGTSSLRRTASMWRSRRPNSAWVKWSTNWVYTFASTVNFAFMSM